MGAKTLLGIDTSTLSISLAVVRLGDDGGQTTLASRHRGPSGPNHSTLLPVWIDELLADAGLRLGALDGIAVGLGPGSFTGLRIALATAKGLAYGARLPLGGASTLEAMALQASRLLPEAGAIIPLLDARKQEVYAGFYRPDARGVAPLFDGGSPDVVAPPEAVAARIAGVPGPLLLLGEGYLAYRSVFDQATEGRRVASAAGLCESPPAAEIAFLAQRGMGAYSKEAIFALEPLYVRPDDVEFKLPKQAV